MANNTAIEDIISDVERVQNFESQTLVQRDRLGEMAFENAVKPAQQLIELFRKLSTDIIWHLPPHQNEAVQRQAKSVYSLFDQILTFKLGGNDPEVQKQQFVEQLSSAFQPAFTELHPLISYAAATTVDFSSLESRGRAALQTINDEKEEILNTIRATSEDAKAVLQEVRDAAAEQGVTQQARYFAEEATRHENAAKKWLMASVIAGVFVLAYAVLTLFVYRWLSPQNTFESVQMVLSKVLIFAVLAYALLQCVRNYSAHRHNSVTNKHRQNALMTYKTLAEAGSTIEARDAVLQHAAAAVYAPNDSGYLKKEERGFGSSLPIAISPRSLLSGATPSE